MSHFGRCALSMILLSLATVGGCVKKIERPMVVGLYAANHGKAVDTLEVKPDGTYILNYRSSDGVVMTNNNRWEFAYQDGEPRITFEKFVFGLPGHGSKLPGYWDVRVETRGRILRLCIDPDLNYYYEKPAN